MTHPFRLTIGCEVQSRPTRQQREADPLTAGLITTYG